MKRIVSILKYLFFLGIGIFLLWLAFRGVDGQKIITGFKGANYFWVFISVACMILAHLSRAMRWLMLIKPLGYKVSVRNSFIAVMTGYMANVAIPRMGEITRCVVLNRSDKVPINKLIGTVVVERVFDFIVLLSVVIVAFLLELDRLRDFYFARIHPGIENNLNKIFTPLGMAIILALMAGGVFGLYIINKNHKENPLIGKLRFLLSGFISGIKTIRSMENNGLFIFHTLFIWFQYFIMTYVVFFAFDFSEHLGVVAGLAIFAIGSVGFIMPVQAGIGTFHWAVTEGMKLYGIAAAKGLTFATLMHGTQTIATILIGAICYLSFLYIIRKKRENEIVEQYQEENKNTADIPG